MQTTDDEWRRCPSCGRLRPAFQHRCRRRTCDSYSGTWAGDLVQKIFRNVEAYPDLLPEGWGDRSRVCMITQTAPGVEQLDWDAEHCAALGDHKHSGMLGCRVDRGAAARWNRNASPNWSKLYRRSMEAATRATGRRPTLIIRVAELQHRGVLHYHLLMGYTTPAERAGADAFRRQLTRLAPTHGFGSSHIDRDVRSGINAAAYFGSYFASGKRGKLSLTESVRSNQMPRSIAVVSPKLTAITRCTMRTLRLRRFVWQASHPDTGQFSRGGAGGMPELADIERIADWMAVRLRERAPPVPA